MSAKKLTILFAPLNGWGHINACHGLAKELLDRGHRVVFAVDREFGGKLEPFGFEEELHGLPSDGNEEFWPKFVAENSKYFLEGSLVIAENFSIPGAYIMFNNIKQREEQYKDIIDRVKPDVIVIDNYICSPTLTNAGIPWVWLFSAQPNDAIKDERIPPAWSGMLKENKTQFKFIFLYYI